MSTAARTRIQLWIYGVAIFALTAGLESQSASVAGAGAAAALLVITTLLVSRAFASTTIPHPGREPIGAALRQHDRRTSVLRQCDPDAPGHARPRAPGHSPLS